MPSQESKWRRVGNIDRDGTVRSYLCLEVGYFIGCCRPCVLCANLGDLVTR